VRKRDIGILAGIGLVALIAAWYFLLISPKRSEIAEVEEEVTVERDTYDRNTARLKKLDQEREAAQESLAELLKLNKLIPGDNQIPSLIVELQKSANQAGIDFVKIEPDLAVRVGESTVVPIQMKFEGRFFDVNDFLYRVENYARLEGNNVNVSGRLVSVVGIKLEEGEFLEWPNVTVTLDINTYTTLPAVAATTARSSSAGAANNEAASSEE
jgi:Tfp pilus assembly protein PilO